MAFSLENEVSGRCNEVESVLCSLCYSRKQLELVVLGVISKNNDELTGKLKSTIWLFSTLS